MLKKLDWSKLTLDVRVIKINIRAKLRLALDKRRKLFKSDLNYQTHL